MNVVLHQGGCAAADRDRLADALGPNGSLVLDRRMEPGFLGSLLLVGSVTEETVSAGRIGFVLLEMWDEPRGAPPTALPPIEAPPITWTAPPRVMGAIR